MASIEAGIVIATGRPQLSRAVARYLRTAPNRDLDWSAIVQSALKHGTLSFLCRHLLAEIPDLLPSAMRDAAEEFLTFSETAARSGLAELFEFLDLLDERGIRAIPFKGPTLVHEAYGETTIRPFRDLDLLIREQDIQGTVALLTELGYRSQADGLDLDRLWAYYRYNGQDIFFKSGRYPIEPHWTFAPRTFSVSLDTAAVWSRQRSVALADRIVPALSREDTLLLLALHGAKEQWSRLIWIMDMAGYVRTQSDLDWDKVLHLADEAGLRRIFLLGLALAQDVAEAELAPRLCHFIQGDRVCQQLRDQVIGQLHDSSWVPISVFDLSLFGCRARERWSDRLGYAVRTLTTARLEHFQLLRLPKAVAFAYPAVKVASGLSRPLWLGAKSFARQMMGRGKVACF